MRQLHGSCDVYTKCPRAVQEKEGPLLSGADCEQALPRWSPCLCDRAWTPIQVLGAGAPASPSSAAAELTRRLASLLLFLCSIFRIAMCQNTHTYDFFFFNFKADPLPVMITCIFPKKYIFWNI